MNDFRALLRSLITFGIALPMAMVIGYMLAQELSYTSLGIITISIGFLCIPLLFKWYHPLLVLSWNMAAVIFILPGRPQLWLAMAFVSAICILLQKALDPGRSSVPAHSIAIPLIFLAIVVAVTAFMTGGLGFRVFGSGAVGGKRYLMVFGAIVGFFALTSRAIPKEKVWLYVGLFFLGGLTNTISDTYRFLPQSFRFLFWVFPVDKAALTTGDPFAIEGMGRFYGLAVGCLALCFYLMARTGVKNMLEGKKPVHLVLFVTAAIISLLGGFRSFFILMAFAFLFMFYFEGLLRSRYLPGLAVGAVLMFVAAIPLGDRLPMSMQRALSFIPWVEVSPVARHDALASTEWRLEMWKELLPEVPEYFFIGKGFSISADDLALASELASASTAKSAEMARLAGDYHNGPLSVMIPFGVWGAIGFVWFLVACCRALLRNFKYGDPELRHLNAFLLSLFLARVVLFLVVFGGFYSDLAHFVGLIGFSLAVNGGIKRPLLAPLPQEPARVRLRIPLGSPVTR